MKKRSNQEQQERMFALIKSCKESGMSNKDFCQQNGIGPEAYEWVTDILNRIHDHKAKKLADLFPHNWKPLQE